MSSATVHLGEAMDGEAIGEVRSEARSDHCTTRGGQQIIYIY